HGVKGSPQDWVSFLIRLDRKRYQPWYFYYPSGMRLPLISKILFEKLIQLHKEFGFKRMCLTAHSMGGLVTRSMLTSNDFFNRNSFVSLFITLATPWSGFESADNAVTNSPRILPSWIDVASRSMFIKKTLGRSLPSSIPYFLFFGKEDSVSEGRALDERAFAGATGKHGFNVNHETILSDKAVFLKYNEILENHFFRFYQ
ncbi:hypothetical protein KKA14_03555, partial [bacterium]|nr:hypothetical protein [bacterium]